MYSKYNKLVHNLSIPLFTTRVLSTSSKPLIRKKLPSPHDLGIHHKFKHLHPIVNPLVNTFSKNRLEKAVNIADLRICAKKYSDIYYSYC